MASPSSAASADAKTLAKQQRQAKIRAALKRFGFSSLRGLQGPALRSVVGKRDTLVLMPTGGGKSLCFQLPALLLRGLVVVVCPLLALMQDQVLALRRRGIGVDMLSSLVSDKTRHAIYKQLLAQASDFPESEPHRIELLYTTPETLATHAVQMLLQQLYDRHALALFAVDEAHCISSWGHDFRPAYRGLGALRRAFPRVPFMALTATATPDVRHDIQRQLQLAPDANVLLGDFNRANISYSVCDKETLADPMGALSRFIHKHHAQQSGVIYVHKRTDTDLLVERLRELDASMKIAAFHGKLPPKERETTLQRWLCGELHVVCATIAFGMGIDHASVRFVVHWNMPKTLENLYQEAGRAGRDGQPSHSVVLYSRRDYDLFHFLIGKDGDAKVDDATTATRDSVRKKQRHALEMLAKVQQFATRKECRRQAILRYFGQPFTVAQCGKTCDVCDPRLQFFRFELSPSDASVGASLSLKLPRGVGGFMKASQVTIEDDDDGAGHASRRKRDRTGDVRRHHLLFQRAGAYAPNETTSVVVRGEHQRALASAGFVAVNGDANSENEEEEDQIQTRGGFRSAATALAEAVVVTSRGAKRSSMESTLDALERAERAMEGDDDDEDTPPKKQSRHDYSRARLASKMGF